MVTLFITRSPYDQIILFEISQFGVCGNLQIFLFEIYSYRECIIKVVMKRN